MNVGSLPNDYFNTSKFFIPGNKKLKENGFKTPRHGRPLRKKTEKHTTLVPKTILYLVLLGIFMLLCIILTLVHFGILQWKQYTTCLPNFNIGDCESMSFLDTYIWKEKKEYNAGTESCSSGVAFRTWAPLAAEVSVIISNHSTSYNHKMKRQNDGCWFSNVCGVEEGMSYYYRIIGESGERTCKKLSLGSREIMGYSETSERSVITSSYTATPWKGDFLSKGIIYQIFLPSFMDPLSTENAFAQLSSILPYFQALGITALQFFPLEQYVCPSYIDISNCWQNISIQYPGVIHQDFGTFSQFRDFVELAHSFNIAVYLEINWSLFDSESIVYNIDCQLSEGSYLHSQSSSIIDSRIRFDLNSLKKGKDFAELIVTRWKQEVGVDGVIWKDSRCMVLDGKACREGVGIHDIDGIRFLQRMIQNRTDFWHVGSER